MLKLLLIAVAIILGFMAFVVGIPGIINADDLKNCDRPSEFTNKCQKVDAIVAISGGDTKARTSEAIKLYKQGWSNRLIFSGAALDPESPSNASEMKQQALDQGVPAGAIEIDEYSQDTAQNAILTRPLVNIKKGRIILVTSPYHQRRAGLEFQKTFGEEVTVVNHPAQNDRFWPKNWYQKPSGWSLAFSETIKTLIVMIRS